MRPGSPMNRLALPFTALVLLMFSCGNSESGSWDTVRSKTLEIIVKANGEMASSDSIKIGCPLVDRQWEFTINFLAPEGKSITEGQMIVTFDDKELRNQLQMEMTRMATAEKNLEKTILSNENQLEDLKIQVAESEMILKKANRKKNLDARELSANDMKKNKLDYEMAVRRVELSKKKVIAHEIDMDSMKKRVNNNLDMYRLNVEQLQKSINAMQVKAPKSGMIVYTSNWRGEKPVVGESVYRGRPVLEIPELKSMIVKALIREPDAGKVAVGQKARITLDANTDRTFTGVVSSLGQLYHMKSWDQPYMVFDAVIEINNPDPSLMRPGMNAKVEIICEKHDHSIMIPLSSVEFTDTGATVFVKRGMGRKSVPVVTGKTSKNEIRILSGLKEGEHLWIP